MSLNRWASAAFRTEAEASMQSGGAFVIRSPDARACYRRGTEEDEHHAHRSCRRRAGSQTMAVMSGRWRRLWAVDEGQAR